MPRETERAEVVLAPVQAAWDAEVVDEMKQRRQAAEETTIPGNEDSFLPQGAAHRTCMRLVFLCLLLVLVFSEGLLLLGFGRCVEPL